MDTYEDEAVYCETDDEADFEEQILVFAPQAVACSAHVGASLTSCGAHVGASFEKPKEKHEDERTQMKAIPASHVQKDEDYQSDGKDTEAGAREERWISHCEEAWMTSIVCRMRSRAPGVKDISNRPVGLGELGSIICGITKSHRQLGCTITLDGLVKKYGNRSGLKAFSKKGQVYVVLKEAIEAAEGKKKEIIGKQITGEKEYMKQGHKTKKRSGTDLERDRLTEPQQSKSQKIGAREQECKLSTSRGSQGGIHNQKRESVETDEEAHQKGWILRGFCRGTGKKKNLTKKKLRDLAIASDYKCDSIVVQAPNGQKHMYAQCCLHGAAGVKDFRMGDKLIFKCPIKMHSGTCLGCIEGSVHLPKYGDAFFSLDETCRANKPAHPPTKNTTKPKAHAPSTTRFTQEGRGVVGPLPGNEVMPQMVLADGAREAMKKISFQRDAEMTPFLSALSHLAAGGKPGDWRLPSASLGGNAGSPAVAAPLIAARSSGNDAPRPADTHILDAGHDILRHRPPATDIAPPPLPNERDASWAVPFQHPCEAYLPVPHGQGMAGRGW